MAYRLRAENRRGLVGRALNCQVGHDGLPSRYALYAATYIWPDQSRNFQPASAENLRVFPQRTIAANLRIDRCHDGADSLLLGRKDFGKVIAFRVPGSPKLRETKRSGQYPGSFFAYLVVNNRETDIIKAVGKYLIRFFTAIFMASTFESSDRALLDLIREQPLGISELVTAMGVTATAVRQRLARLMQQGLIQRREVRASRGRPSHRYQLTERGQRQFGSNFADLALALWDEIRKINEPEVRNGLMRRVAQTLAAKYAPQIRGVTAAEKMSSIAQLLAERDVPFSVKSVDSLTVLTADACPYPQLAEQDRSICSVEKMLFSQLMGENVRLSDCRLDGASCCTFEVRPAATVNALACELADPNAAVCPPVG